jgi:hypothetical protein
MLKSKDNMDLKIYERRTRPVVETSWDIEGETAKKTTKIQTTWEHLPDQVGDIPTTLSMLLDIQTDPSTTD